MTDEAKKYVYKIIGNDTGECDEIIFVYDTTKRGANRQAKQYTDTRKQNCHAEFVCVENIEEEVY